MLRHQAFGDRLIEEQQIRITRWQRIEVEPREALAVRIEVGNAPPVTEFEKRFNQPMLLEKLERTWLDADGARPRQGFTGFIDETHGNAGARQTHRGGEARRTSAGDQNRRP